jgi:hypothetical protein
MDSCRPHHISTGCGPRGLFCLLECGVGAKLASHWPNVSWPCDLRVGRPPRSSESQLWAVRHRSC